MISCSNTAPETSSTTRAQTELPLGEAGFAQVQAQAWRSSQHATLAQLECRPYKGELIYDCVK